ncbi:hypothetical protein [Marinibactrum halimedae]|uniref:Exonuclease domain-containing protein n=1 Tax=Marinibactrum halimedae TaxID=1444977 RepID=A0AA37T524_9GAMM|nr:hypothetical protein [Marinibactrum halimedae]MCD9457463.1 hypothetical protein [Marinibactrum halimedae]GLS25483.1 hypothetical protein GCM10007877_11970 [Marinibactrum halimedae]
MLAQVDSTGRVVPLKAYSRPNIIDIEASGFGTYSYPIEIGIALRNGLRYSRLIRPCDSWTHWDKEAESLHGISRSLLHQRGLSLRAVAMELNEMLCGKRLFTDAWVVDKPWLDKLFQRAGIACEFSISPLECIMSEGQLALWADVKGEVCHEIGLKMHRAIVDAVVIQETYVKTKYY